MASTWGPLYDLASGLRDYAATYFAANGAPFARALVIDHAPSFDADMLCVQSDGLRPGRVLSAPRNNLLREASLVQTFQVIALRCITAPDDGCPPSDAVIETEAKAGLKDRWLLSQLAYLYATDTTGPVGSCQELAVVEVVAIEAQGGLAGSTMRLEVML